jgi:hypothetical protein
MTLYPDAAFILNGVGNFENHHALYFVEIDRGTESSGVIGKKLRAYHIFSLSKEYKRYAKVDFFRVLFITTNKARVDNIIESLKSEPGLDLCFFSDFNSVEESNVIVENIWFRKDGNRVPLVKQIT